MFKIYKYRIYPSTEQKKKLSQAMGCVRFVYNKALETKNKCYKETGKTLSYFDLANGFLIELKKENDWLNEVYSQSLQSTLKNLDNAFTRFFRKQCNFPKFKSKHDNNHSIQYPQFVKVDWSSSKVQIPKCGKVLAVLHRKFEGKIKTCTISKTPTNKFFISIIVDDLIPLLTKPEITKEKAVGIDLGIKDFVVLSDGTKFSNPKHLRKVLKKLEVAQRRLSRKKKGSNNKNKERIKVAKVYEKITNQRNDFLHKLSSSIIKSDNQTFILEDLSIKNMLKNHNLALSISDCGWGNFTRMLDYKAEWYGKNIIYIGRFEPSSKMCSCCGSINKELKLSDREWTCSSCKTEHDRDINAAINIKKLGLIKVKTGQELPAEPVEISRRRKCKQSLRMGSMKQEANT